jgi:hypothetical protein
MNKHRSKSFFQMTVSERDREVERYDHEIDIERDTKPLTAKQKLLHEKAAGRVLLQRNGLYTLKIDPKLMTEATRQARRRGMSVSKFIEEGVRGMLTLTKPKPPKRV